MYKYLLGETLPEDPELRAAALATVNMVAESGMTLYEYFRSDPSILVSVIAELEED